MVGILAARPVWAIQPCRRDPNNRQDLIKASIPRTLEYFCAVSPNLAERKSSQTTGSIVSPLHAFHSVSLPFSALFVAVFSVLLFPAPRVRVKVSKETSRTEIAIDLGSIYSSVRWTSGNHRRRLQPLARLARQPLPFTQDLNRTWQQRPLWNLQDV